MPKRSNSWRSFIFMVNNSTAVSFYLKFKSQMQRSPNYICFTNLSSCLLGFDFCNLKPVRLFNIEVINTQIWKVTCSN